MWQREGGPGWWTRALNMFASARALLPDSGCGNGRTDSPTLVLFSRAFAVTLSVVSREFRRISIRYTVERSYCLFGNERETL